jgi:hypothetical protein
MYTDKHSFSALTARRNKHEAGCFMPVPCLAYSSTVKMEIISYSERPADLQQTISRYVPEERTPQPNLSSGCGTYKNFNVTMNTK